MSNTKDTTQTEAQHTQLNRYEQPYHRQAHKILSTIMTRLASDAEIALVAGLLKGFALQTPAAPSMAEQSNGMAAAIAYVEEQDYINDENRRCAGEGFLAGVTWATVSRSRPDSQERVRELEAVQLKLVQQFNARADMLARVMESYQGAVRSINQCGKLAETCPSCMDGWVKAKQELKAFWEEFKP